MVASLNCIFQELLFEVAIGGITMDLNVCHLFGLEYHNTWEKKKRVATGAQKDVSMRKRELVVDLGGKCLRGFKTCNAIPQFVLSVRFGIHWFTSGIWERVIY